MAMEAFAKTSFHYWVVSNQKFISKVKKIVNISHHNPYISLQLLKLQNIPMLEVNSQCKIVF